MNRILAITILLSVLLPGAVWSMEPRADQAAARTREAAPDNQAAAAENGKGERTAFRHVVRHDIGIGERFLNLGVVYIGQWAYYLIVQRDTIMEVGSFKNWYTNMYQPHFDLDSYFYNIVMHSLAGMSYYLFYRSRGYSKLGAFLWGFVSQLLFEFTIETITEKPSFQDLFQTPMLGTLLGITIEYLSNALLGTNCKAAHVLGYILNPFALLPFSSYEVISSPRVTTTGVGYSFAIRF